MSVNRDDICLLPINVERDAAFAHSWFTRPGGRDTLLSMGNAEHEIVESTLAGECATMRQFIDKEERREQITRAIVVGKITVGVVWIELHENHGVRAPSVHIMIGDVAYRGKGIGSRVMRAMIDYAFMDLHAQVVYSRHLADNTTVAMLNRRLGFIVDGAAYSDENGLLWQNVMVTSEKYRMNESTKRGAMGKL